MNDTAGDLERALAEVERHLTDLGIPHMLIGGLALAAWGLARSTLDIDITLWSEPESTSIVIDQLTSRFKSRSSNPHEFVGRTRVLPLQTSQGVRVDILFAAFPFELRMIERAVAKPLGSAVARVASREDLLLTKLISTRPKDRADVDAILDSCAGELDWEYIHPLAVELAAAIGDPDLLNKLRR